MKKKVDITILTSPVGFFSNLKLCLKHILGREGKYGGHWAVTRSLIEGLQKIEYDGFNYQPAKKKDIARHVHVLANVDTLKYAIRLKKQGKIDKLTAGPNIVVFSDDYEGLIGDDNVELYLQPSFWAANLHIKRNEKLALKCVAWPAGIDLSRFDISKRNPDEKRVLIYHKYDGNQFIYRIDRMLRKKGYETNIFKYGSYSYDDYIDELSRCSLAVVVSSTESQGLCLAEAWAMDVPTLCFDPHYYRWENTAFDVEYEGDISSCPYLTDETGRRWSELSELMELIDDVEEIKNNTNPREWVVNNMTDEICAKQFLKIVGIS